jgi:outer membrane protein OmpA-like peptidoglycan-associated protein
MRPRYLNINWAAGATLWAIGALAFSLLQISACSRTVGPLASLNTPPRPEQPTLLDKSTEKVELRGVQFLPDGSISPDSKPVLEAAVELLKDKPNATIYVDAYCDPTGGRKLNLQLSEARATAVTSYLESRGVPANHIVARGFGASNFIATNATASGRSQNRRIELLVRSNSGLTEERAEDVKRAESYAAR